MMESGQGNAASMNHCGQKRCTSQLQQEDRCFNTNTPDKDIMNSKRRHCTSKSFLSIDNTSLRLHVRRTSLTGASRVARLPLININGVSDLRGLFRRLIYGAFSENVDELPDYLRTDSDEFYMFTPQEDFVSLPGDTIQTQFKLVAALEDGRQFVLAERILGGVPDPARRFLVTVAEFESEPIPVEQSDSGVSSHDDGSQPRHQLHQEQQHLVVSLVSYPTVSVQKDFLDAAMARLAEAQRSNGLDETSDALHYHYRASQRRCSYIAAAPAAAAAMIRGIADGAVDDHVYEYQGEEASVAGGLPIMTFVPLVGDDDGDDDDDDGNEGQTMGRVNRRIDDGNDGDEEDDDETDRSTFTSALFHSSK